MLKKLPNYFKQILFVSLFSFFGLGLEAQLISVVNVTPPGSPTSCTSTNFDVLVQVNCNNFPFNATSYSIVGNTIFMNVDYTSSLICTGALAFNSHTISLGNVAGGNYTVVVTTSLDNGPATDTETSSISIVSCCSAISSFTVNSNSLCSADQDSSIFVNTSSNAQSQEWYVNNNLVSTNVNYSTLFSNPGVYDVKLKVFGSGCADSTIQTVAVSASPNINLGPDINACVNDVVTLNAGSGYPIYDWSFGVANSQFLTVNASNEYSVIVTNNDNCTGTDTINVVFNPLPLVDLGPDTTICANENLTLDAGAYTSFLWSTNEVSQTIDVSAANTYSVEVVDSNACVGTDDIVVGISPTPMVNLGADTVSICNGDSAILDAGSQDVYLWNTGEVSQIITPKLEGMYSVEVSNAANCTASDSAYVKVNSLPNLDFLMDTSICDDISVTIDAGNFASYTWFDSSSAQSITLDSTNLSLGANTISLSVEDANACTAEGSFVLTLIDCDTISTSIRSNELMKSIQLFPNPSKDFVQINLSKTFEQLNLQVLSLEGRVIIQEEYQQENKVILAIDHLPSGVYFLELRSQGQQAVFKLVKE